MKMINIMLTALTVVAAVGGTLAFTANKSESYFCGSSSTSCPDLKTNVKSVTTGFDQNFFCSTQASTTNCPIRITTVE